MCSTIILFCFIFILTSEKERKKEGIVQIMGFEIIHNCSQIS